MTTVDSLAAAYTWKGMKGLTDALTKDLGAWKNTDINIAVTGSSGAGKTTFINTIRGLNAYSEREAPTGTTETTTETIPNMHPFNPKLFLTELPGVGCKNFPKKTYIQTIGFERFDLFIIVSKNRFTENDIWLANEIVKRYKKFYFLRTNFDTDVKNEKRKRKNKTTDENELKLNLRHSLEDNLKGMMYYNTTFIIDNFQREKYDFPELEKRLNNDMIKKETMVLTRQAVTEKAISEKKEVLEGRIWQTALCAAFTSRANDADIVVLKKEKEFYVAQFNLDEESLKHGAEMANKEDDLLAERFKIKTTEKDEKLKHCNVDEFVKRFPFLPIGNHIKMYRFGTQFLQDSLNSVVERAMEVNQKLDSDIAEKCTDLDWYLLHVLVGKR